MIVQRGGRCTEPRLRKRGNLSETQKVQNYLQRQLILGASSHMTREKEFLTDYIPRILQSTEGWSW